MKGQRVYHYRPPKERPPLTQFYLRQLLDYNPKTGIWRWRNAPHMSKRRTTQFGGKKAGYSQKLWDVIRIDGRNCLAHRLAVLYVKGEVPVRIKLKKRCKNSSKLSNILFFPHTTKRAVNVL